MTGREATPKQDHPLRHPCYLTNARVGFVSFLDLSDLVALGLAFYLSGQIANKVIPNPTMRLLFILLCTVAAWFVNFAIKKRLYPYPKFVEFFLNWWLNGVDYYVPDVDTNTVPLIVTREMTIGHSFDQIEKQVAQEMARTRRLERRTRRVRKTKTEE
ncbi:hypothetical protein [Deinococcus sp. AJ005]|uniref:hypothetical protein n=1 Tax=Deinococcus sp. AJ005 TaxID=2652443 RepID=UPI00125CA759|nr:hypothetical protein [Deinococcus sp. AJ005]QFP78597.1 hypothetical protein DAAJ005_18675 [Deinococcus sp. AJ005]